MTKITFIGAGSLGFTGELVRDILTFPLLEDATISLMDIDPEHLEWAKKRVEKLIAAGVANALSAGAGNFTLQEFNRIREQVQIQAW